MTKIELDCCEGKPNYSGQCLRDRCPIYSDAKHKVNTSWPYVGTGYGNLYGNPKHRHYLSKVKRILKG